MASTAWSDVVRRIRVGEQAAAEELYQVMRTGIYFAILRQLGWQSAEDRVHDIFLIVTQAIRAGGIREPERLMGYISGVTKHYIRHEIKKIAQARSRDAILAEDFPANELDPEVILAEREEKEVAARVLNGLQPQDREILVRFHVQGQSMDKICLDLHLTRKQFYEHKSRAKTRFGELGRAALRRTCSAPARRGGTA